MGGLRFSAWIGWRFNRATRGRGFLSFISASSTIGIALGIAVIIILLSAMNGFEKALSERLLQVIPHAELTSIREPIRQWPVYAKQLEQRDDVVAVSPFIRFDAMVSKGKTLKPLQVRAIDWEAEQRVAAMGAYIHTQGNPLAKQGSLVLGKGLATQLGIDVGDNIHLLIPGRDHNARLTAPKHKLFTVSALFDFGGQVDRTLAFISIPDGQAIAGIGDAVQGLRLSVTDLFNARATAQRAAFELPIYLYISDWMRTQGHIYQDIQLVRAIVYLVMVLIIAVACFNIVSTLVMAIDDKRGDIAILKTMGASSSHLFTVVVSQGMVNGVTGTLFGALFGSAIAVALPEIFTWLEALLGHTLLSADIYFIDEIPSQLRGGDVLITSVIALLTAFISTLYPAWTATRLLPAKELNNH